MIKQLLAAVAAVLALQTGAWAEETIKLGVVNIDTGPYAVSGAYVNDGANFAVESLNVTDGVRSTPSWRGQCRAASIRNHEGKPTSRSRRRRSGRGQGVVRSSPLSSTRFFAALDSEMPGLERLWFWMTPLVLQPISPARAARSNYFGIVQFLPTACRLNAFVDFAKQSGIKSWDLDDGRHRGRSMTAPSCSPPRRRRTASPSARRCSPRSPRRISAATSRS